MNKQEKLFNKFNEILVSNNRTKFQEIQLLFLRSFYEGCVDNPEPIIKRELKCKADLFWHELYKKYMEYLETEA